MKFFSKKSNKSLLTLLAVLFLAIPLTVFAINTVSTGFQVGSSNVKIDAHGTCKQVRSTSGTLFVPTKSSAEWSAFRSNKPSGVTLSSCYVGCSATTATVSIYGYQGFVSISAAAHGAISTGERSYWPTVRWAFRCDNGSFKTLSSHSNMSVMVLAPGPCPPSVGICLDWYPYTCPANKTDTVTCTGGSYYGGSFPLQFINF